MVKSASYLFFLSKQSEWWRPIDDNPRIARVQLHRHGENVARLVRTEPDPLLALAIVFVFVDANILRITFNENWSHGEMFGGVRSLIGLDSIPEALSRVFHSANEDGRQAICFLASDFGMCLGCVARYLYGHRDRDLWEPVIRHREETIKKELRPSTVRALERSMSKKGSEVRSYLRFYSCNGNKTISSRAQYLLRALYRDHRPTKCLPCEAP